MSAESVLKGEDTMPKRGKDWTIDEGEFVLSAVENRPDGQMLKEVFAECASVMECRSAKAIEIAYHKMRAGEFMTGRNSPYYLAVGTKLVKQADAVQTKPLPPREPQKIADSFWMLVGDFEHEILGLKDNLAFHIEECEELKNTVQRYQAIVSKQEQRIKELEEEANMTARIFRRAAEELRQESSASYIFDSASNSIERKD